MRSSGQPMPSGDREHIRIGNDQVFGPTDTVRLRQLITEGLNRKWQSADSGIHFFMNTLQQSRRLHFPAGISISAVTIGQYYLHRSAYQKSIEMNLLAIRYAPASERGYQTISMAYNNIANAYVSLEKPFYAAYYYYRAADVANKYLKGENIEYLYCNLSNSLSAQYALYYLEKAEAIARRKGNDSLLCITLSNKAVKYQHETRNDSAAFANLEEALLISRRLPNRLFEYRILIRIGAYYLEKGAPEQALVFLRRAERLHPSGDSDASHRNRDLITLGLTYLRLNYYDKASGYFLESLKTARELKLQRQLSHIYAYLGEIAGARGAYEDAYRYQQHYIQLKDSFINETVARSILDLEIKYRTAEKDREIARKEQGIQQRNLMIGGIMLGGVLLSGGAVIYYRHLRQRQKMLQQEQEIVQLKALMEGEEIERSRIARELHDGIMVHFSSVKMNLSAILKCIPHLPQTEALHEVVQQLDDATTELRKSAHNLMPDMLLREGLAAAVQYFCRSVSRRAGLEISFLQCGPQPVMLPEYELMCYRIIQELLQNALKYAAASHIIVQLDNTGRLFTITVEDDGSGFDLGKLKDHAGSGLAGIRSRIETAGGTMEIQTAENAGTTIYIEIETVSLQLPKSNHYAHNRSHRG